MRTRRSRERVPRTFLERLAVLPRGHGPSEPARRQGGLDRRAGVHDRADVVLAHGPSARQRRDRGSAVAHTAGAAGTADCASGAFPGGRRGASIRVPSGGRAHTDGRERRGRGGTLGRTGVRGRASDRRGGAPGTRRGGGSRHRGGGGRGGLRGGPCEGRRLPRTTLRSRSSLRRFPPPGGRAAPRRPNKGAHSPRGPAGNGPAGRPRSGAGSAPRARPAGTCCPSLPRSSYSWRARASSRCCGTRSPTT